MSDATCLLRPRLFYAFRGVKDHRVVLHDSPLLKKTCVRQAVVDKWFPLVAWAAAQTAAVINMTSIIITISMINSIIMMIIIILIIIIIIIIIIVSLCVYIYIYICT